MIVVVLRTKPSGLYRHRRGLGLHRESVAREEIYISELPSLPSMQRRVPPGHGTKSSILYLHSPTVRPKYIVRLSGYPLIQETHNLRIILIAAQKNYVLEAPLGARPAADATDDVKNIWQSKADDYSIVQCAML